MGGRAADVSPPCQKGSRHGRLTSAARQHWQLSSDGALAWSFLPLRLFRENRAPIGKRPSPTNAGPWSAEMEFYLKVFILSLIQGAAELLPVSSSAHVILAQKL